MAKDTKRPKVHPVVAKLVKAAKEGAVVPLEGYVGETAQSVIRLHPAVGVADYTDVPEDAVLHVEEDIDAHGRARVWVKGSAMLQEVRARRADAPVGGMSMARLAGGTGPGRPGMGFFGDIGRCLRMAMAAYDHCIRTNPHVERDITVCDDYAAEVFRQCMAGERTTSPF
jgi:hypothetical protein